MIPLLLALTVLIDSNRTIDASFSVNSPKEVCYAVLTDYENLPKFISSMKSSKVLMRIPPVPDPEGGPDYSSAVVEQEAEAIAFFLNKKLWVKLAIIETPNHLEFEDLSLKDFEYYKGYWNISDRDGLTVVEYHLESKPRFKVYFKSIIKSNVSRLLNEVKDEMERRAK